MSARILAARLFASFSAFLLLVLSYQASAQIGNSTLSGTVTDTSGAAIVGAQLTLTSKATSFQQKVTSNDRGEYTDRFLADNLDLGLKAGRAAIGSYRRCDLLFGQVPQVARCLSQGAQEFFLPTFSLPAS